MSADLYRYIVRHDAGTAPNPFSGWCTLAICKPRIRKSARPGDWVIGFRSRTLAGIKTDYGHVLYAMRVTERLSFEEYWLDSRFISRRPSRHNATPDNIYRPVSDDEGVTRLEWVPNHIHGTEASRKDTSGQHVLVSDRFWYFGERSCEDAMRLPLHLLHLAPTTQGHVVHSNRVPGDLDEFESWLGQFPMGLLGQPTLPACLPDVTDISKAIRPRCSR